MLSILTENLFSRSDAFTTIIGMQFMSAFVMNILDPLMMYLLPDKWMKDFDILLHDSDDSNDKITTIQVASFLRKLMLLSFVIFLFYYVL
jgi:hypothetical protein